MHEIVVQRLVDTSYLACCQERAGEEIAVFGTACGREGDGIFVKQRAAIEEGDEERGVMGEEEATFLSWQQLSYPPAAARSKKPSA